MRRVLIAVFIFLLLATSSSSSAGQQASGTPAPSTQPEPLRFFPRSVLDAELKAAGRHRHRRRHSFRLSDYSGRVLVVSLWATWCGPCRLETPVLVKLDKQFRSQGVQIVELTTEDLDAAAWQVRRWIRNFGVHYRVGFVTVDVAQTLMQGRDVIPQVFVISRSGRIIKRLIGFSLTVTPSQLKLAIEEALNEKVGAP